MKKARAAVASSPDVEATAEEVLRRANAVDAVVAGVFAACAVSPAVLLGPVQILIGGGGQGLRAIDGRVRQPGIGAPRPRGFVADEEVPDAARIGTPCLPAALSVTLALAGSATFAQVLAPAIALAKGTPRSDILKKIGSRGPRALEERPLSSELLAIAGRPNGGLLTSDDLSSPQPRAIVAQIIRAAKVSDRSIDDSRTVVALPWANADEGLPAVPASDVPIGSTRGLAVVDRHGTFAMACWDDGPDGIWLSDLGLKAPFSAEPVRRGQTRVKPGEPRPAAAPMAIVARETGPQMGFLAFGAGDAYDVLGGAIRSVLEEDRIEAHGEAQLVAVSHVGGNASVFR